MQVSRTEKQASSVVHTLRYLPGGEALKLRAEVSCWNATCVWLTRSICPGVPVTACAGYGHSGLCTPTAVPCSGLLQQLTAGQI